LIASAEQSAFPGTRSTQKNRVTELPDDIAEVLIKAACAVSGGRSR
jgi:hypothetical protein